MTKITEDDGGGLKKKTRILDDVIWERSLITNTFAKKQEEAVDLQLHMKRDIMQGQIS